MTDTDRVLAAIAAMRERAHPLDDDVPALAAVAEAAARLPVRWWAVRRRGTTCRACGRFSLDIIDHAPDCPAMDLDAALARLADEVAP